MFQKLLIRLKQEKNHFDDLGVTVKNLLYSYALYLISYPIMGIFINTYFWRQTNDISLIAAYNLGFFIALPLGFYLNGLLLRRFHILKLYWVGNVLQGLAAFLAIFIPSLSFTQVFIYGLIYGIGGGLYWGNKNYITLKITKGKNRLYYNNLESSLDLVISIIMPILIGWTLVFGEYVNLYSTEFAYKILMLITLALLWLSGYLLQSADIYSEEISHLTLTKPSRYWNLNRLVHVLYWTLSGVNYYVPTILVLIFVGAEAALGTIESITALLVAILLYVIGRKSSDKHLMPTIIVTGSVFLMGAVIYNLTYGFVGAIIYSVVYSLTSAVSWNSIYSNSMEVMDRELEHGSSRNQYALVLDNEIYFNLGRILGMALFFGLVVISSQETSLRLTPLIAGVLQLVMLVPLGILMRYTSNQK